jgi:hypothetical protein
MSFRPNFRLLSAFILLIALPSPASAQAGPEAEVRAAAQALLDSWRQADPAKTDAVLHPSFRLVTMRSCPNGPKVDVSTRERLVEVVGRIKPGDWDDRLANVTVRVDPTGIAVLFADYRFFIDGKQSHGGAVTMQFYRTPAGWRIASFADTHTWLDPKAVAEDCASG